MTINMTISMLCIILFATALSEIAAQDCSVDVPIDRRRDCYPWPDHTSARCQARGCAYCPSAPDGVPWCYADDEQCPSTVPEINRVDCHPEPSVTREACNNRGCIFCTSTTLGIPWCFYDDSISQGGLRCPAYPLPDADKVDCWPHVIDADTESNCLSRSCYYCETSMPDAPWCVNPPSHGYTMNGPPVQTTKGWRVDITRRKFPTWAGADIEAVRVDAEFQEDNRLRVKIYDPNNVRFEVPLAIPSPDRIASNPLYDIQFGSEPAFHFKILRRSSGEVIFDTSIGGLEFSDQALQIAAKISSPNVYGFGETEHHSFRHDMNWVKWPMYARDQAVAQGNLYGVFPFYTCLDDLNPAANTKMHGVLILNSNAQEVTMTPAPGIVYRTNGGILDLYFFLGPSPEQVIQQYTAAVGRPYMPPYWALGFHLSRYGYNNLQTMQAAINRLRQYDIPHDVQHGDIDTFDRRLDFTYDPVNFAGLPQYVRQLKQEGTRYITIVDPFIGTGEPLGTYPPFDNGNQMQVWITEADGVTPAESTAWPDGTCYYPDYSKPSCHSWWTQESMNFHQTIEFDGLWIDMNEPASFSTGSITGCSPNNWNYPIFVPESMWGSPGSEMPEKTLCPDYRLAFGRHYDVHSLYGWSECQPSLWAARNSTGGKRSIVISRSMFPGAGQWATHWLGDNHSQWTNMHYSIIGMLEFNMFGVPFVGADICGFGGDTTQALCQRWMQLGSFYGFSRNHNGLGWTDQDPGLWPEVARVSRETLHIRYTLLPYLYTLFHEAHSTGSTVIRSLLHEFVTDSRTHGIDRQFLWGPAFLITPVVDQGATTVDAYFPDARWYDWYSGSEVPCRACSGTQIAPMDFIPLHLRGGYIIPTQEPANSTMFSRNLPMGLIITYDENNMATGSLFWDEGDTIDTFETGQYFLGVYSVTQGSLTASIGHDGYSGPNLIFNNIKVLGEGRTITSVQINGNTWTDFQYDNQVLQIQNLNQLVRTTFTVTWS